MELKYSLYAYPLYTLPCINRTFKELKLSFTFREEERDKRINRTFMELKSRDDKGQRNSRRY